MTSWLPHQGPASPLTCPTRVWSGHGTRYERLLLATRYDADRSPTRGRRSGEVEAIEVHDLVPRRHEVTHELLLRVVTCVDLRDASEWGVRTEDEIDGGACPLDLARRTIATLVHVLLRRGCLPLRAHVDQVHEEVVGQRLGPVREDAVLGLPEVGVQGPHAADENRHLGSGQRQQVGPRSEEHTSELQSH